MFSCISLPFTKLIFLRAVSYTSPNEKFLLPNTDFREHNMFF